MCLGSAWGTEGSRSGSVGRHCASRAARGRGIQGWILDCDGTLVVRPPQYSNVWPASFRSCVREDWQGQRRDVPIELVEKPSERGLTLRQAGYANRMAPGLLNIFVASQVEAAGCLEAPAIYLVRSPNDGRRSHLAILMLTSRPVNAKMPPRRMAFSLCFWLLDLGSNQGPTD